MKFAVTGHTGGIGSEIIVQLKEKFPDCEIRGYSRATNYDLTNVEDVTRMANHANDCDIFINCVFGGHAQTMALYKMWEYWQKDKKIICSIDSNAVDRVTNFPFPYAAWKAAHQRACKQLEHLHRPTQGINCKVVYPEYGLVDTECSQRMVPQYETLKTIKVQDACKTAIDLVLMNYESEYYFPTIKMLPEEHIDDCWIYDPEMSKYLGASPAHTKLIGEKTDKIQKKLKKNRTKKQ